MKPKTYGASAEPTGPSQAEPEEVSALRASVPCARAARVYRIDQHGPYRRWILVCDGEDVSGHNTIAEARMAMEQHKHLKPISERTGA